MGSEEKGLVFAFSIAQAANNRNVATVSYELEKIGEDGVMVLKLQGVRFLQSSEGGYVRVVLTHLTPGLYYKKGLEMERLFPGWRRAGYVVKDITECDVTFERFWNLYRKKVGNKAGVEKKWGKLSWDERVMAIGVIPRMRRYYEQKGLDLPYPETYINQRRWENEFEG